MASSSSSAHRLRLDLEPAEPAEAAEADRLLPVEHAGPTCDYFGDDAPTLELLLPTTRLQLRPPADSPARAPMARLRLQRRQVKRDDPDGNDD